MKTRLTILSLIFLFLPAISHAATEFVSVIDPDNGSGTDYTSLSAWEAANQVDLTAATTLVIAGSLTRGTIADGVAITQTTTGATAVCVHHSGTQMLISTLVGTPDATSTWYPTVDGSDATNAWTPTDAGDSAIAIAKCRSTAGTADTTAVTIDGWTTSATNYIKVWTDPSENYRHQGKWDEGKYRLSVNSGNAMTILENYIRIDGLQIYNSDATYGDAIRFDGGGEIWISQSILRGNPGATDGCRGVYLDSMYDGVVKIYNNVMYDWNSNNIYYQYLTNVSATATLYIYNNTFYGGNEHGMNMVDATKDIVYLKNNISYNSGSNDYNLSNNSLTSSNNISSDATSPDGASYQNQIVHFADEANDDFHLDSADTAARNAGTILYDSGDDANLNFTTDIDNNARLDSAGTWDIGADEAIAKVYRSVGPSATTAIATGGTYGNVEVKPAYLAGSTTRVVDYVASFWSDLPTNVGVGDALQYDDDDDGDIDVSDSIVFITKRIDASHFSVRTASGAAPASTLAPDSDWSIFRAYTSLFNAEAGDENDSIDDDLEAFESWSSGKNIATSQEQWNIAAYAGQGEVADTVAVTINEWTTSADSYIKIYTPTRSDEVGTSQRHEGVWDDGKYKIVVDNSSGIINQEDYVKIEGLQVRLTNTATSNKIGMYILNSISVANNIELLNNIIDGQSGSYSIGIYLIDTDINIRISNNIIYDCDSVFFGAIRIAGAALAYIYNNTIVDSIYGIVAYSSSPTIAINNIVSGSGDANAYLNTFATGTDYNATDGTDDIGAGSNNRISQTFTFADSTNDDFRLAPGDAGARNFGADLSNDPYIPFNTDITSTCLRKDSESRVSNGGDDLCYTRPRGASWDIGAHELITKIYRSVAPGEDEVLETGASNHLNISGSTATFDTALGDDVGVGDVLEYDDDNDGDIDASDSIVFITGRTSSTVFTVKTATGGVPTAPSAADEIHWNINRAYTSLTNAEAGTENTLIDDDLRNFDSGNRDIVTNSEQWNIACYAHGTEADSGIVVIDGWTTSIQNYIRIFTPYLTSEVGTSQRHSGKWDGNKYRIEYTPSGSYSSTLRIRDNHIRIDGLQVQMTNDGSYTDERTIQVSDGYINSDNEIIISNNIVKGDISGTSYNYGIISTDTDSILKVYNNIVYGFDSTHSSTSGISNSGKYMYTYNNIIYNSYNGIRRSSGTVYVKNNITQNCTDGYNGTFDSSSDYNLSDLASDAPGANSKNSAAVSFLDESNSDFHLSPSDTSARNSGIDLSQDYWLPITTDIDGNYRPKNNTKFSVDIGADESATPIYRSIAPSMSTYLDRGVDESGTDLTISGSTMTLENATPDNVGVGDVIQYDSDGNSSIDAIAFISARTSSTQFTVQARDGSQPVATTNDQDWQIFRAYTTLDNAEGGAENITNIDDDVDDFDISVSRGDGKDIYASNEQWNIAAYANGTTADTNAVTINGWTTYPTNYIKIYTPVSSSEVGISQRHSGVWDDNKYRLITTTDSRIVYNQIENVVFDGIQIARTGGVSANNECIRTTRAITVKNSIFKGHAYGIYVVGIGTVSNSHISNSVFYDHASSSIRNEATGSSVYVYNVTSMDCGYRGVYNHTGTMYVKNTISMNSVSANFVGITSQENNLTSGVSFLDETNDDFHLASTDTSARDAGVNLWNDSVLPVREDIDGDPRSEQGGWDIGADEGIFYQSNVAGHGTATMQMSLTDKMTDGLVGMWSFDGPDISGTTAYDRSPAGGNNGTITGATPVIGKRGQALSFDGNNQMINAGSGISIDDIDIQGGGGMTIAAWIKPLTLGDGGTGCIICKEEPVFMWCLRFGATNALQFYRSYSSVSLSARTVNNVIFLGAWQHVIMTWNGNSTAASDINFYVNGSEISHNPGYDVNGQGDKNSDASRTLIIGDSIWGAGSFNGLIDEVRIYNRVLSSDEILRLYNLGGVEYVR